MPSSLRERDGGGGLVSHGEAGQEDVTTWVQRYMCLQRRFLKGASWRERACLYILSVEILGDQMPM